MRLKAYYWPLLLWGMAAVIDGDTVDVCHPAGPCARVRLADIDAPERHTPAGRAAAAWLRSEIDGRIIACRAPRKGPHGRFIGLCYVNGIDVSALSADAYGVVARKGRRR